MKELIKVGALALLLSASATLLLVTAMHDFDVFVDITKDVV